MTTSDWNSSTGNGAASAAVAHEVAYIGDDIIDAPIMAMTGLPITVADAADEAKNYALIITKNQGGKGAVREITDFIRKAKGLWKGMFVEYFKA